MAVDPWNHGDSTFKASNPLFSPANMVMQFTGSLVRPLHHSEGIFDRIGTLTNDFNSG